MKSLRGKILRLTHLFIDVSSCQQLFVSSQLHNPSTIKHTYQISMANGRQSMGHLDSDVLFSLTLFSLVLAFDIFFKTFLLLLFGPSLVLSCIYDIVECSCRAPFLNSLKWRNPGKRYGPHGLRFDKWTNCNALDSTMALWHNFLTGCMFLEVDS